MAPCIYMLSQTGANMLNITSHLWVYIVQASPYCTSLLFLEKYCDVHV